MTKKYKGKGHEGFGKDYWQANYSEPEEMDGIVNAAQHAQYMKSFFDVDYVDISTVIDFGFGLGNLFQEVLKAFVPYRAWGIEPSAHAFEQADPESLSPARSTKLKLKQWDLKTWSEHWEQKSNPKIFDLGICTSVFQYLTDKEIKAVLPAMSECVRYLYFSVPTDIELGRQTGELEFTDEYAIRRTQSEYLKLLEPHFTIIGNRILESKVHFNEDNTYFTDLLFRF